jgi:hypothetical protein
LLERTGKQVYSSRSGAKNSSKELPRRILYPSLEQSVNKENYSEAIQIGGSDNINMKVWWRIIFNRIKMKKILLILILFCWGEFPNSKKQRTSLSSPL